jgi:hypothetical protein
MDDMQAGRTGVQMSRIVSHFSCGAASAVATKLVLAEYPADQVLILNAYIKEEHPDNQRFLRECEAWFGHKIIQVRDEKYGASCREAWRRKRFIKNRWGAACSKALKRDVLESYSIESDVFVLGYTADEVHRLDRFIDANNGRKVITPLIDRGLTKSDCLAMLDRSGIAMPEMYRLGFNNNNCIGCCKGGMGYWNHVRRVFPDEFEQVASIEEMIGPTAYIFRDRKTGERISLRQLPPDAGRHDEPEISCSVFCEMVERELEAK